MSLFRSVSFLNWLRHKFGLITEAFDFYSNIATQGRVRMEPSLKDLYARYLSFTKRREEDLLAVQRTSNSAPCFPYNVRYLTEEEFKKMWAVVCSDEALKQRWLHRLSTGYDGVKEEVGMRLAPFMITANEDDKNTTPSTHRDTAA